jgi:surfactin synthase thioesterase subunit
VRELLADQGECLERFPVNQRVTWPGDPYHLDDRAEELAHHDLAHLLKGFAGGQEPARRSGAILVGAVVSAGAVAAFDVATWSNSKVHSAVLVVVASKTGVPLYFFISA